MARLGDPAVHGVDIGPRDRSHLHAPQRRADVEPDQAPVVGLRRFPLARQVLGFEPVAQVVHRGCAALVLELAERVAALVHALLEALGLVTGRRALPLGGLAYREAPLPPCPDPVRQDVGSCPGRGDTGAKSAHIGIVGILLPRAGTGSRLTIASVSRSR